MDIKQTFKRTWRVASDLGTLSFLGGGGVLSAVLRAFSDLTWPWVLLLGFGVALLLVVVYRVWGRSWVKRLRKRQKQIPPSGGRVGIDAEDSEIDLEDSTIKNQDVGMDLRRSKFRGKRTDIE